MRPLEGCLVVAVEQAVAAPFCTARLADAGARVIKIERAGGETARHYDRAVDGTSAYFAWLNRGKESIVLDLKSSDDLGLLEAMIARADVFVQNLAPGAAARLGLASEALVSRHPRLIAADIVGYDPASEYRTMKAYDLLVQAEAGLCALTGTAREPVKVGVSVADIGTGMNSYTAILEALIERGLTGRGRALTMAMFDSVVEWAAVPILHQVHTGRTPARRGMAHNLIAPYTSFRCRDGDLVVAVQTNDEWRRFCVMIDRPDLAADPRFATNEARRDHAAILDGLIAPVFAATTRREMIARLERAGVAFGLLRDVTELADHPALRRTRAFTEGGPFWTVASPLRETASDRRVPRLDEHGASLREEFGA